MRPMPSATAGVILVVLVALTMSGRPLRAERVSAASAPVPQSAPTATTPEITLEAEEGESAAGKVMMRSNASELKTLWLHAGESVTMAFSAPEGGRYVLAVRYSNDQARPCGVAPCQAVRLAIDGRATAYAFAAQKSGSRGWGYDWNAFLTSPAFEIDLQPGQHRLTLSVEGTKGVDSGGPRLSIEVDCVTLTRAGRL
jgi:hypothetical protein